MVAPFPHDHYLLCLTPSDGMPKTANDGMR